MEKKRQQEEEAPTEGKKMCKEGMRAKSALMDFSSKDTEVLEDFGGFAPAPAAQPAFSFGSQPAPTQPAFMFGSHPAPTKPAFNSESYGAGFKAGFESGFEAGFKAASNGGLFGNNQAKPSLFRYGVYSQAKASAFSFGASSSGCGSNNLAKPSVFSFGGPSTDSGAPTSQGTSSSSLASLERYKQVSLIFLLTLITISLHVFKEEKTSSLLTPEGSRLLGQAEDLNIEANATLQAQLAKINKNLNF